MEFQARTVKLGCDRYWFNFNRQAEDSEDQSLALRRSALLSFIPTNAFA